MKTVINMGKEKILHILDILKKTDEEHALTIGEIISKLRLYGIDAERKSVSRDIQALIDSGNTILSAGKREGYYLADREFDDYELAMIYAAVARAKFITEKDTRNILKKLRILAAPGMEKLLSETVAVGAVKTDNVGAKYAIDKAIRAIRDNRKLRFQYIEYDAEAKKQLRRGGHVYVVSPFYLAWAKDELFLIANPDSHAKLTHFKIAMLTNVEISDEPRKNRNEIEDLKRNFDLRKYMQESVNMYSGDAIAITLRCHISLLSELINEFGRGVWSGKADGEWFTVTIRVADNDGLYRWVMQFGGKIEVISPDQAREAVKGSIAEALELYG